MSARRAHRVLAAFGVAVGLVSLGGTRATAELVVQDVGPQTGLPQETPSWDAAVGDLDGDGMQDLVISYHSSVSFYRNTGSGVQELFSVAGNDPHGCTIGDVNDDGLGDVYCTRGAEHGTMEKGNTLWMQTELGVFEDRAGEFGVLDPFGRGRRTTFLDIDTDGLPDLFVGNGFPRQNEIRSPNRSFVNVAGSEFREVFVGLTGERRAGCVQAVDQNKDRREDLLVCGRRLFLYRSQQGGGFRDVARELGISRRVESAGLVDLDGDGRLDLVTVTTERLVIRPGTRGATFGPRVLARSLVAGRWVTFGNVDGRRGLDILVVQGCSGGANLSDHLLIDRRGAWGYRSQRIPQADRGCGDVATSLDMNQDGRAEFVVLNGRPAGRFGPVQVLTTRWP